MRSVVLRSLFFSFSNLSFHFLTFFYVGLRWLHLKRACVCDFFICSSHGTRERLLWARVQPIAERKHQKARTNVDYDLIFSHTTVCHFAKIAENDPVCYVVPSESWD